MSSPTRGPSRRWRIVATDDDPTMLNFVVLTLREAGHCVFAAYDGNAACELALYLPEIDLLITNTHMGTLTAQELVRQVRGGRPELPILHVGESAECDGLLDGVPTLDEPFTSAQLLAAVEALAARGPAPRDPPES